MELAALLEFRGRRKESEAACRQAFDRLKEIVHDQPTVDIYLGFFLDAARNMVEFSRAQKDSHEESKILRDAITVFEGITLSATDSAEERIDVAARFSELAKLLNDFGRKQESQRIGRRTIEICERLGGGESDDEGALVACTDACLQLGRAVDSRSLLEVEATLRQAVSLAEKLAGRHPDSPRHQNLRAAAHRRLGDALKRSNRPAEAEKEYQEAIAAREKFSSDAACRQALVDDYITRARISERSGNLAESARAYRRVIELEPKHVGAHNNLAWLLATWADPRLHEPSEAVALARKAVELEPKQGMWWNTLGAAQYRAGDWAAAIEDLNKAIELRNGGDSFDWFFLAMAHWRLGHTEDARKWYDRAAGWMDRHASKDPELRRFRSEAASLLSSELSSATNPQPR
jgi:tetratricopeptide (TPR) repeat protein